MSEFWKSNFLSWAAAGEGRGKSFQENFFFSFFLFCILFCIQETLMTALIAQCLLLLITWQDTLRMLFLHRWLVKKNTSMIEIHNYTFTSGLSQVFPNSPIFTYLATCQFAGHLYSSHLWNIWGLRCTETVKPQRWTLSVCGLDFLQRYKYLRKFLFATLGMSVCSYS